MGAKCSPVQPFISHCSPQNAEELLVLTGKAQLLPRSRDSDLQTAQLPPGALIGDKDEQMARWMKEL